MRGTGIVRRVKEGGLIAIPNAIRNRLNIGEDCYLEFFIDEKEGTIMLKKYEPVSKKTYEQDFLEKFPKAPKEDNGELCACVRDVYGVKCPGTTNKVSSCKDCWNRTMEE